VYNILGPAFGLGRRTLAYSWLERRVFFFPSRCSTHIMRIKEATEMFSLFASSLSRSCSSLEILKFSDFSNSSPPFTTTIILPFLKMSSCFFYQPCVASIPHPKVFFGYRVFGLPKQKTAPRLAARGRLVYNAGRGMNRQRRVANPRAFVLKEEPLVVLATGGSLISWCWP